MLCVSLQFYIFNNKLTPVEDYWYIQNVSIQSSSNNGMVHIIYLLLKKKNQLIEYKRQQTSMTLFFSKRVVVRWLFRFFIYFVVCTVAKVCTSYFPPNLPFYVLIIFHPHTEFCHRQVYLMLNEISELGIITLQVSDIPFCCCHIVTYLSVIVILEPKMFCHFPPSLT